MHLKIQRRNERDYLSIVQNYRQAGKTKTRTIETIGYADSFASQYDDPIAHFRDYVAKLNEEKAMRETPIELAFGKDDAIDAASEPPARLGAAIALGCLDAIGVADFFRARSGRASTPEHAGRMFEMLAAERMMHAASKRESWTARASFPRACDFSFEDLYAALPYLARESRHLADHIARTWRNQHDQSNAEQAVLVCATYGFPDGGSTTYANVAVALDEEGIPLCYSERPGRLDLDAICNAADATRERAGSDRIVVIASELKQIGPTIDALASEGNGFVLLQHDFDESPGLSDWIESSKGYANMGGDVEAKTRISERVLANGSVLPVREVVLRGGGYAIRKGHAVLVSSETNLSISAIVQLFREIWRQAEPFQPLEADFSPTPFPVAPAVHIRAHFAVCYAAFFALRVLRRTAGWQHNAADTADALLRMEGTHLQRNYYLFNYRNQVTDAIETSLDIPPAHRLRTRAELRSIPATTRKAIAKET